MAISLSRAQEIVTKRSYTTWHTPPSALRKHRQFLLRWERHCEEVFRTKLFVTSYRKTFDTFFLYQQSLLDKPDVPPIGAGPSDMLYLGALEIRLRGRFIPITEQSPTILDRHWKDVCETYIACVYGLTKDAEWACQHHTLVKDIFLHADDPVFPKVYVTTFSTLIPNLLAFTQRVYPTDENPPFLQEFRILLRALFGSISYF